MTDPTLEEYRDGFRHLLMRLLDYELGRGPQPRNTWLDDLIERDARARVEGR